MRTVQSALAGTQTEKNLYSAFNDESVASTKYKIYAERARDERMHSLGITLDQIANQEREHAEIFLDYLGENSTTLNNLENAVGGEATAYQEAYTDYAEVARREGFDEIAQKFDLIARIEQNHDDILSNYIEKLKTDTLYKGDEDSIWMCTVCGYGYKGETPPDRCPVCSYNRGYFIEVCTDDD